MEVVDEGCETRTNGASAGPPLHKGYMSHRTAVGLAWLFTLQSSVAYQHERRRYFSGTAGPDGK